MKSKSMRLRASLYKAHILIAVVPMLLAASSQLLAQVRSAPARITLANPRGAC